MSERADARAGWTLAVVFLVMFLVSLDLSIVNVALPDIEATMGFGPSGLSWVINAFLLSYAGLMLLGARLADLTGRRTLLLVSLAVFGLASAWGGAAQHGWELLAARVIQGAAAAVLAPMSLALATSEFAEGPARAKAIAVWGGAAAAGGALGVVLSGILTDHLGWRSVMWVNLVFVALAVPAVLRGSDNGVAMRHARPDVLGAILVTAGVSALVLGVIATERHAWGSISVVGWFCSGVGLLVAFVWVEKRTADPLVPLGFLRRRALIGAMIFGFLLTSAQIASFYFVSQFLQRVLGYSPTGTGLAFLPFCAGIVIGLRIAMVITARVGPRWVLLGGGLLGAAGLLWFGAADASTSLVTGILGPSLVASIGIGAAVVAMGVAAVTGVPPEQAGLASGVLNSARQLGGSLGLAILVTVAADVIGDSTEPVVLADGYTTALQIAAGLLAVGAIATGLILPRTRRSSEPDVPVVT
ncbi:MFS transporter [Nocardia noduli]|uniref:MFS transporter n=1 Tax=Nocardia noduli TaxID=2815722 RepID=UPI001C24943B|nr:MFS transporter [Nocardia noduli]